MMSTPNMEHHMPDHRTPTVRYYLDEAREWRWQLTAANGEVVASGEGHSRLDDAERAFARVSELVVKATPVIGKAKP